MSGAAVAALRRLARPRAEEERCGLCSAPLAERHEHLVEPSSRRVECACQACALLFDHEAETRWRRVGRRVTPIPADAIEEAWDSLDLPIALAFVARWSAAEGAAVATSPSPLGVVDHPVRPDQLEALAAAHPAVGALRPDVEALLVHRGPPLRAFVVPIDRCFALAGRLRAAWSGLGGGPRAAAEVRAFLDALGGGRG